MIKTSTPVSRDILQALHVISDQSNDEDDRSVIRMNQPNKNDVLCGKVKYLRDHPGNITFQHVIQQYQAKYNHARCKQEKMTITRDVVQHMQKHNRARFLKFTDEGEWVEVSDAVARDKVSHALRHASTKTVLSASKVSSRTTSPVPSTNEKAPRATDAKTLSEVPSEIVLAPMYALEKPVLYSSGSDFLATTHAEIVNRQKTLRQEMREAESLRRQRASSQLWGALALGQDFEELGSCQEATDLDPFMDWHNKRMSVLSLGPLGLSFEEWDAVATLLSEKDGHVANNSPLGKVITTTAEI